MRSSRCRSRAFAFVPVIMFLSLTLHAAEDIKAAGDSMLPESTFLALVIPDLQVARDAWGKTRTAGMFAQPEVQAFLRPVLDQMNALYGDLQKQNAMLPSLQDLDKGLLSGEIVVGVFARDGGKPGILLSIAPKDAAAFEKMLNTAFAATGPLAPNEILPMGRDDTQPGIVWTGSRFIAAATVTDLKATMAKDAKAGSLTGNTGYSAARAKLASSFGWAYVRPAAFGDLARGPEQQQVRNTISALGFGKDTPAIIGLGVSAGEPVIEAFAALPSDAAQGIGTIVGAKPVSAAGLKLVSADAQFVSAGSLNVMAAMSMIRSILEPKDLGKFDETLAKASQQVNFDIQKDLLDNLDGEMVSTVTGVDTGMPLSMMPGMITSIKLKDAAKVEACIKKLSEVVTDRLAAFPMMKMYLQMKVAQHGGKTIYYSSSLINGGTSICVTDGRLLYANSLNAIKRAIDQLAKGDDITASKDFQETIARLTGKPFDAANLPAGFSYARDDSSGGGALVVSGLGIASGTAFLALAAESFNPGPYPEGGPDPIGQIQAFMSRPAGKVVASVGQNVDLALWPDEGFFAKYRHAKGSVTIADKMGIYLKMELPPPMPGIRGAASGPVIIGVAAVGAGLVLPVLARARESARRTSSASNMHQFGIACTFYADAQNGAFPANPLDVVPNYIDPKALRNPSAPDRNDAYVYLAGVSPTDDQSTILLFENVAANAPGRNVLYIGGSVEFLDEASFQKALKATEDSVKARNGAVKQVPIDAAEAAKKGRAAGL